MSEIKARQLVAGVDEVGRGPLAGPVVAAAVIFDPGAEPIEGLADSKKLSPRRREQLAKLIRERSLCWALGRAEPEEIDRINILWATMLAMQRAVENLVHIPSHVQVDGNRCPELKMSVEAIIRGDGLIPVISAASILAKVDRDREMIAMDERFPGYGFAAHKGYPTREHISALERQGVSAIHRHSFAPVRRVLER